MPRLFWFFAAWSLLSFLRPAPSLTLVDAGEDALEDAFLDGDLD